MAVAVAGLFGHSGVRRAKMSAVRARGSRWVCSRAAQRASPPVLLYSASGGFRRTAKAPICDFSAGWGVEVDPYVE